MNQAINHQALQSLSAGQYNLAEGIIQHPHTGQVWWTNIHAKELWQLDLHSGQHRYWSMPQRVCCFAFTQDDDVLLVAFDAGLALFNTASGAIKRLMPVEAEIAGTRCNDGRVDRAGNLVFGTMYERGAEAKGHFYRFDTQSRLQQLALPAIAISNSLAFSPDGGTLYWCDSLQHKIMQCAYDSASGAVADIRVFYDLQDQVIEPDGSTVDAAGYLWNAEWAGHCVTRYAPDGRVDRKIQLPVRQPTCVTFGGPELDTLLITSARAGLDDTAIAQQPEAGSVFAIQIPGVRGLPEQIWLGEV
ncbi:SMP-30/gluconolactonase/LRE family protein [Silvimonas sp. JCM 19000]